MYCSLVEKDLFNCNVASAKHFWQIGNGSSHAELCREPGNKLFVSSATWQSHKITLYNIVENMGQSLVLVLVLILIIIQLNRPTATLLTLGHPNIILIQRLLIIMRFHQMQY